ncbi:winged helix-turn-helix transcriptional regulator [Rubidibacter lacunae]|uniref:winged helix-turn-helix transcriptional regulator n=1 Tax=Rubidibacter lacunae TaxID=582514 RepID=UPI0008FEF862
MTCPNLSLIEQGRRILSGKWKGSILWHLKDGPVRFNVLARKLGCASKKVVAHPLKKMEDIGLVQRNVGGTKARCRDLRDNRLRSNCVWIIEQ